MRNWLGQDIQVGSTVYRGAREGNSSSFKVGIVVKLNEEKGTARVNWKYEPHGYFWRQDGQGNNERVKALGRTDTHGSPDVDTLVVLDVDLARLQARVDLADEWRETGMPTDIYNERLLKLDEGR